MSLGLTVCIVKYTLITSLTTEYTAKSDFKTNSY